MKNINTTYWIVTGLFAAFMTRSSIPNAIANKQSVELISGHPGYPAYLVPFIGIAKLLAVAAILVPGFPRLKEWAYAGLAFDLVGTTYSLIAVGDPFSGWVFLLLPILFLFASYYLYHARRRLTRQK